MFKIWVSCKPSSICSSLRHLVVFHHFSLVPQSTLLVTHIVIRISTKERVLRLNSPTSDAIKLPYASIIWCNRSLECCMPLLHQLLSSVIPPQPRMIPGRLPMADATILVPASARLGVVSPVILILVRSFRFAAVHAIEA